MSRTTGIEYVRSTRNFWTGCTKIGPGCDRCYAERFHAWISKGANWGPGAPRTPHLEGAARDLRRWDKQAAAEQAAGASEPWRVFINTQSDFFDNEVPQEWRDFAWSIMRECKHLTFVIVTKRVGNVMSMLPADWGNGYPNVWLLITVTDQREADRDIPKLVGIPMRVRGISAEPLLGLIDLTRIGADKPMYIDALRGVMRSTAPISIDPSPPEDTPRIDWVITGGESGPNARPSHPDLYRALRDQCAAAGVAYLHKQNGEFLPCAIDDRGDGLVYCTAEDGSEREILGKHEIHTFRDGTTMARVGKRFAGRMLDRIIHDGYPGIAP